MLTLLRWINLQLLTDSCHSQETKLCNKTIFAYNLASIQAKSNKNESKLFSGNSFFLLGSFKSTSSLGSINYWKFQNYLYAAVWQSYYTNIKNLGWIYLTISIRRCDAMSVDQLMSKPWIGHDILDDVSIWSDTPLIDWSCSRDLSNPSEVMMTGKFGLPGSSKQLMSQDELDELFGEENWDSQMESSNLKTEKSNMKKKK